MLKRIKINKIGKPIWQSLLAILMILACIYFIKNEHLEITQIKNTLQDVNSFYLFLGLILTVVFVLLQALLYVFSFKTAGVKVGIESTIPLFLKRNLISVFLPAGGFSSLMFFTRPLTKKGIKSSDIYYASYIYGLAGVLSVVIVAIPVLGLLSLQRKLSSAELIPFLVLVLLVGIGIYVVWSFLKKKMVYRLILKHRPKIMLHVESILNNGINIKHFLLALLISILVEITGVLHVYISMLALGFHPTLLVAFMAYIIMIMLLLVSPFLRGMGAIEVSMTYIFIQNGIPAMQAAVVTLLFRFFEFWLPLLAGVCSFFFSRKNIVLRVLPVFIMFMAGLFNVFSALSPVLPDRVIILEKLLPKAAVLVSSFTLLFLGLILIILSVYLLRGVRRAWKISLFLLIVSVIGHLVKGINLQQASLSILALASLLVTHRYYNIKATPVLHKNWWAFWLLGVAIVVIAAISGTYFLERQHMGIEYNFYDSVKSSFHLIFLFDASGYFPHSRFGHNFVIFIYILSGTLLLSAIFLLLRPIFSTNREAEKNDFKLARLMVKEYGKSALDYFKYYPDKRFFFTEDAFIAYRIKGNYAIALGVPVGTNREAMLSVLQKFEQYCYENGLRTFYYRVAEAYLPLYQQINKEALLIGRVPLLNLERFSLESAEMLALKEAVNEVKKAGFTFQRYSPESINDDIILQLKKVSNSWQKKPGKTELTFSQGMFIPEQLKKTPIMTIENQQGKIVAFLNIIPDYAKKEGTYDLIRTMEGLPEGIVYFLLSETFNYLKERKIKKVNMGMVVLSGIENPETITEKSMKFALERIKLLEHFKGQYQLKDSFNPDWENKYLMYDTYYDLLQFPGVLKGVSTP